MVLRLEPPINKANLRPDAFEKGDLVTDSSGLKWIVLELDSEPDGLWKEFFVKEFHGKLFPSRPRIDFRSNTLEVETSLEPRDIKIMKDWIKKVVDYTNRDVDNENRAIDARNQREREKNIGEQESIDRARQALRESK